MEMTSRVGAAVVATFAILVACGAPQDPVIPAGPADTGGPPQDAAASDADAGTTSDAPAGASCDGAADGTPCGGGKICVGAACLDPACGDGITTPPEECDRGTGNAVGSGCEPNCTFTCVSSDSARGCPSSDPCVGAGTCDPSLHTCTAGAPLAAGSTCGTYKLCAGGNCVDAVCGDDIVTAPEQCDNGSANGPGTGCETNCKFTCNSAQTDCAAVACNTVACSATHTCTSSPDASQNGQSCGSGLVCKNGACIAPGATCGNGVKETGEDCDFGAQNGPGTGCEITCKFSCATAATCVDPNACDASPTCNQVTVNGQTGQKCVLGAPKPDGSSCGIGSICVSDVCKLSVCGDGIRDDAKGEQCDDGNTTNLDGCDSACKFEQDQRAISLQMQWAADAYCTKDALGAAIQPVAQGTMQSDIDSSIADGSLTAMFKLVGDPTGASGAVNVGSLTGTPVPYVKPATGTSDLDWWYTVDAASIDGSRNALAQLTGTYAGGAVDLTGTLNLIMSIGGSLATLHVSGGKVHAPIGSPATTPTASSGTNPPGHLASEHLSPTLKSFPTMGGTLAAPSAQLCGNISANSLANAGVPAALLSGFTKCSENYTSQNRGLDVFVHGCTIFGKSAIAATQPDQIDPSMPAAGAGGPYALSVDAQNRVNQCKDKNGTVVSLTTCLNAAAYSSSFKFATDRVIIR